MLLFLFSNENAYYNAGYRLLIILKILTILFYIYNRGD